MNQAVSALILVGLLYALFGPEPATQPAYTRPDVSDSLSDVLAITLRLCLLPILLAIGGGLFVWIPKRRRDFAQYEQIMSHDERRLKLEEMKVAAELEILRLRAQLVYPESNMLPLHYNTVANETHTSSALALNSHAIEAQRTYAPVPHTIHYKPSQSLTDVSSDNEPVFTVPTFSELHQSGKLPSTGFLLGYRADGTQIVKQWNDLYSCIVNGTSGTGKSTLVRLILAQAAMQNSTFLVADPHYGAGAESLGASLSALGSRMLSKPARDSEDILNMAQYVEQIGLSRLRGQGDKSAPLIFVVDEITSLLQRSDISKPLEDIIGLISTELRKVGVYAICLGQNFNSSIIKTNVRDCFASVLSTPAPRGTLGRMVSAESARTVEKLKKTQALWAKFGVADEVFTFPNTTQYDIELVSSGVVPNQFPGGSPLVPVTVQEPLGNQGGTTRELDRMRVRNAFNAGASKTRIYEDLLKGKMRKQDAFSFINSAIQE